MTPFSQFIKIIVFPVLCLLLTSNKDLSPPAFDPNEIDALIGSYFSNIEKFANEEDYDAYEVLIKSEGKNILFKDISIDHDSGINHYELDDKLNVENYLVVIDENMNSFSIGFQLKSIENCSFQKNGQQYAIAKIEQTIKFQEQNLQKINTYDVAVDITQKLHYRIDFVKRTGTFSYPINNCGNSKNNSNEILIDNSLKAAAKLRREEKPVEALNLYQSIVETDPKNVLAKIEVKKITLTISQKEILESIQKLINEGQYQKATKLIEIYTSENPENSSWSAEKKQEINNLISRKDYQNRLKVADKNFNKGLYQIAKKQYQSLKTHKMSDQNYLNNQIEECNSADPDYVKNLLQQAYNAAVKSEDNRPMTFKTYYKYYQSGLLKADQYHFMCLMLLKDKPRFFENELGITSEDAVRIKKESFFRAKKLGYNNSKIENYVFTSNYLKK